jgi:ubiquinone/menaquinone biosynthesis C-methylase UbiE
MELEGLKTYLRERNVFADLTKEDVVVSATVGSIKDVFSLLSMVEPNSNRQRMADLGCGFGGLSKIIADYLHISEVHGIDLNDERLGVAMSRGLKTYKLNLETEALPFADNEMDFLTSFGVLEHLNYYDNAISEAHRVLKKDGYAFLSIPNLGSWINRMALLLGYQPRDIEVSHVRAFGSLRFYGGTNIGHLHSATTRALEELLEYYGFRIISKRGFNPYATSAGVKILDSLFSIRPSWSRRVMVLAKKAVD